MGIIFIITAIFALLATCFSWTTTRTVVSRGKKLSEIKMEYIPDGISKAQWEAIKKKEQEENKNKNLGAVGITKFKSRSFEAWQKSGQEHLFPVDPTVPLEARPYMQRQGGSADATDLLKKGVKPKDQAKPSQKTEIDAKYEKLEKENKLRSYPFQMPWTSDDANKIGKENLKSKPDASVKSKTTAKGQSQEVQNEKPAKKGFFGIF